MIVTGGIPRYGSINRSHALARGLVAMFRGGAAMGSAKTWYDLAGNNNLSMIAAPTWKQSWMEFNGTTHYGTFGGTTNFVQSGSPFTAYAIVRLASFGSSVYPHIFSLKTDTANIYEIGISSDTSYLGLHFGSTTTWSRRKTDIGTSFWLGLDRTIMVTYNGQGAGTAGNFSAYVDGVPATTASAGTFGTTTNTTSAMGATLAPAYPWNGRIYRAGVWNRCLSASEAKMLALRPDAMFNHVETPFFGGGRLTTKNLLHGRFGGLLRGKF